MMGSWSVRALIGLVCLNAHRPGAGYGCNRDAVEDRRTESLSTTTTTTPSVAVCAQVSSGRLASHFVARPSAEHLDLASHVWPMDLLAPCLASLGRDWPIVRAGCPWEALVGGEAGPLFSQGADIEHVQQARPFNMFSRLGHGSGR